MLKSSKISGSVQEVILPDFPDDDNTVTTVTKSRRVSFGTNFVKEFIVGSAVSGQCMPEYEQAFPSSDSSNADSGADSGLLEHSMFVPHDGHDVQKSASQMPEPNSMENRPKVPKFSSTVCFSADSPTADMEFTEGCITLAKSILDKKNKEMTVIIQAKPKEPKEDERGKEEETKYFEGSQFDMSMTRCLKSKGNKREEKRFEGEKTKIFNKFESDMSITRCNRIFSEDDSEGSWEECKENRMPLDMIMRHLDKDNSDLENDLFNPEKTFDNFLSGGPFDLSNDSEKLNMNESMDISTDLPNVLKMTQNTPTASQIKSTEAKSFHESIIEPNVTAPTECVEEEIPPSSDELMDEKSFQQEDKSMETCEDDPSPPPCEIVTKPIESMEESAMELDDVIPTQQTPQSVIPPSPQTNTIVQESTVEPDDPNQMSIEQSVTKQAPSPARPAEIQQESFHETTTMDDPKPTQQLEEFIMEQITPTIENFQSTEKVEQQSTEQIEQQSTEIIEQQSTKQIEQQLTKQIEQQSTKQIEQQLTKQIEQQSTEQIEQQSTEKIEQQSTKQIEQQSTKQIEEQSTEKVEQQSTNSLVEEETTSQPSLVDLKVIESLKEQSNEPGCVWSLKDIRHPGTKTPGSLSLNCSLLESTTVIVFTLKMSNEDSLDSCSLVTGSEINLEEETQLRLPEYRLVIDFGFGEVKKFLEERIKVGTVRHVPYFLDQVNPFVVKMNGNLRQIYEILTSYPGSRLSGSRLSFRMFSFPIFFSSVVTIDLSNLFRLTESALSFEKDFGSFEEEKIREIFEKCLKRENCLCEFVVEATRYLFEVEKAMGYVSKRRHIRLLPEELKV